MRSSVHKLAPPAVMVGGLSLLVAGEFLGHSMLTVGSVSVTAAVVWIAAAMVLRRLDYATERARAEGYDDGYDDGYRCGFESARLPVPNAHRKRKRHLWVVPPHVLPDVAAVVDHPGAPLAISGGDSRPSA